MSFYPLLLARYGYAEDTSGLLLALRAVGAIAAGLIAGRFVRTGPQTLWPVVCAVGVAAGVGLLPAVNHLASIGLWMLVVGFGSGAMTLYFQITIAEASRPEERGAARLPGGMGWSLSCIFPRRLSWDSSPTATASSRPFTFFGSGAGLRRSHRLDAALGIQAA
jgi:cyanate permease